MSNAVAYERFVPAPGIAAAVGRGGQAALKVIGVIEHLCEGNWPSITPVGYLPSDKGFWSDAKLKAGGYWRSGVHERDAIRIGLQHLHFALKLPYKE